MNGLRSGSALIRIIFVLLSIAIVVAVFALAAFFLFRTSSPEVTVPNLTGRTADEAIAELSKIGLACETAPVMGADTLVNTVARMSPEAGSKVKTGRNVILYIVVGAPPVIVPELCGTPLVEAENILLRAGMEVGGAGLKLGEVENVEHDSAPGTILKQDPLPGVSLPAGGVVNVTVAIEKGGRMPNLEGMNVNAAIDTMEKRGYRVEAEPYYSTSWPAGTISSQNPAPGAKLTPDIAIKVVYALAPGTVPLSTGAAEATGNNATNPVAYPSENFLESGKEEKDSAAAGAPKPSEPGGSGAQ